MSEQQKKPDISGKVLKIKEISKGNTGWTKFDVVLDTGDVYEITNQPGSPVPQAGDQIGAYFGKFDKYYFKWEDSPPPKAAAKATTKGESDAPAEKPAYVKPANKEDYFRDKAHYDEHVRDPKIEFQCYWTIIGNAYAAAIPTLEEPPKNVQEVDAYIDQAFDKAKAIYLKVNDKKAVKAKE
jgi:hypothetical protein